MAYRNGVYIAFNGCNTTNPTEGDLKYYGLLKAWKAADDDFTFSDSHEKTYQVSDESRISTLKNRLQERMRNSKNMLVIITENSSWNRGLLNWEIEQCVGTYDLPLIVVYPQEGGKLSNVDHLKKYWPSQLSSSINSNSVRSIHIPFKKEVIFAAINTFTYDHKPDFTVSVYNDSFYNNLGLY